MGQPSPPKCGEPDDEFIVVGSEPGELKHLSNLRKRNHRDSPSSGERKGKSLNLIRFRKKFYQGLRDLNVAGRGIAEMPGKACQRE